MKPFHNMLEYARGALFNIVFMIAAVAAVIFAYRDGYSYGSTMFVKDLSIPYAERTLEIPESEDPEKKGRADAMEVGRILEDAGLVKNALVFFAESRLNGSYSEFRPGTYEFNTHMANNEIMDMMKTAKYAPVVDVQVIIPEGSNLRQIGQICEAAGLFTAEEFLQACSVYPSTHYFIDPVSWRENPLEGYLFPDTYRLPDNPIPSDLISRMLTKFSEVFDYEMEERARELGYTIDEVVIMASIIEKEISVPEERAVCSSIIHNRLKLPMNLAMCSTVLFALDIPKSRLYNSDLEIDSPYNTYKYPGLPRGPISNPGRAALQAALYPADTNYLYMVVKDEEKGEHFFTNNYNEHLNARDEYNQPF